MLTHRGLVNYLSWCVEAYDVDRGTGATVQSSLAFDATITSLWSPLLVGQRVVLLPEENEVEALSAALRGRANFSLVKITPAFLDLLNRALPADEAADQARALIIGGEPLSENHLAFWRAHAPETRLINEYGPTGNRRRLLCL